MNKFVTNEKAFSVARLGLPTDFSLFVCLGRGRGRLEESTCDERQVQREGVHLLHTRGRGLGWIFRVCPPHREGRNNSHGIALTLFSVFCQCERVINLKKVNI
jgi:hypothetical protein